MKVRKNAQEMSCVIENNSVVDLEITEVNT